MEINQLVKGYIDKLGTGIAEDIFFFGGVEDIPDDLKLMGFKHIEYFGGEGMGNYAYSIFKIDEKYYRLNASYQSWDGYDWDWDSIEQVKPVQVTKTEYVPVMP
jgi:hypothetical protein